MIDKIKNKIKDTKKYWREIKKTDYYKEKFHSFKGDLYTYSDNDEFVDISLRNFLIYINKPKESITWMRIGFINTYCKWDCTSYDTLVSVIDYEHLYDDCYEEIIPEIIDVFVGGCNEILLKTEKEKNYIFELIGLYKSIAQAYLECDGGTVEEKELKRIKDYINSIEEYVQANLNAKIYHLYNNDMDDFSTQNIKLIKEAKRIKKTKKGNELTKELNRINNDIIDDIVNEDADIKDKLYNLEVEIEENDTDYGDIFSNWQILYMAPLNGEATCIKGKTMTVEEIFNSLLILFLMSKIGKGKSSELNNVQKEFLNRLSIEKTVNESIKKGRKVIKEYYSVNDSEIRIGHLYAIFMPLYKQTNENDELKEAIKSCGINIKQLFIETLSKTIEIFMRISKINYKEIIEEIKNNYWQCFEEDDDDNNDGVYNEEVLCDPKVSNKSLNNALAELDDLIGLESVKKEIKSLINLIKISKIREEHGLKKNTLSNHLVFLGNPGTGKTTVARLVAEIYHQIGLLSKGHLIEVDRSGLVGGYVGQTAIKVRDVIKKAIGGILFIDEAYSLTFGKEESDFGYEAVDTLLKGMEDNRDDLVVIVAGYTKPMKQFLKSNPGLESRFNKMINFQDYKPDDLYEIFSLMCRKNDFIYDVTVEKKMREYFLIAYNKRQDNFANGRMVRNTFERIIQKQANRLANSNDIDKNMLSCLTVDDLTGL